VNPSRPTGTASLPRNSVKARERRQFVKRVRSGGGLVDGASVIEVGQRGAIADTERLVMPVGQPVEMTEAILGGKVPPVGFEPTLWRV
jgi:hypothetical protein